MWYSIELMHVYTYMPIINYNSVLYILILKKNIFYYILWWLQENTSHDIHRFHLNLFFVENVLKKAVL